MTEQCHFPDAAPETRAPAPSTPNLAAPGKTCRIKLSFSIFFDGTRNNKYVDMADGSGSFSNIARLYEALDQDPVRGVYRLYVQGVGTEFAEIGEVPRHDRGASMGAMGANRIRYAFIYVANRISEKIGRGLIVKESRNVLSQASATDITLDRMSLQLTQMLSGSTNPKVDEIVFDVFGFSRGATAARSFVNQLNYSFGNASGDLFCGVPMRIRFMGLFDTVASVGFADSVPGPFEGHQGWGDQSLLTIPKVDNCVHLVAGHEGRNSFPVDLIRKDGGGYPANSVEIVYPGMHSDVGGGYGRRSQGKGTRGTDGRLQQQDSDKISQIALNDMYERATAAGVPLLNQEGVRRAGIADYFEVRDAVRQSFNTYMGMVRPAVQGKRVETHLLEHRRHYFGWRKLILEPSRFESRPFVRDSATQDAIDLKEANLGLIRRLEAIEAFPARLAAHRERYKNAHRNTPPPPNPPLGYEFHHEWKNAAGVSAQTQAFFENYIHDSRAHFLLTDPQGDDDHKIIHDRLEGMDRRYRENLRRYQELYGEAERDYLLRGEASGYTATSLPPRPSDPLSPAERRNLNDYRAGKKPIFNDENPATRTDGEWNLPGIVGMMHGRREGNWSYLNQRQVFAYRRTSY